MLGGRELPQYAPIIGAEFVSPSYNVNESYLEFRFHFKLEICLRPYARRKLKELLRNFEELLKQANQIDSKMAILQNGNSFICLFKVDILDFL